MFMYMRRLISMLANLCSNSSNLVRQNFEFVEPSSNLEHHQWQCHSGWHFDTQTSSFPGPAGPPGPGPGGPVIVTVVNTSRTRSNLTVDNRPGVRGGPSPPLVPPDTTQKERRLAAWPPGLALPDPAQT